MAVGYETRWSRPFFEWRDMRWNGRDDVTEQYFIVNFM